MTALHRGLVVTALHVALAGSLGASLTYDRARYPRVWVRTAPVDPYLPIRGRYVSLRLEAVAGDDLDLGAPEEVRLPNGQTYTRPPSPRGIALAVENGRLVAHAAQGYRQRATAATRFLSTGSTATERVAVIDPPVAFFIPEGAPDPSRLGPGEELWVEVTVPPTGGPRPIRLAVRRDGAMRPVDSR